MRLMKPALNDQTLRAGHVQLTGEGPTVEMSHRIHGDAQRGQAGLSQRPQLGVSQQSWQDAPEPLCPQGHGLPPHGLRPLALHVLIHAGQSAQGP